MPSTAPSVFPERPCCPVTSARPVDSATATATARAQLAQPDPPERLALMVPLALLAHKEQKVCPDICQPSTTTTSASAALAPMDHLAHPAPAERREPQELQAQLAHPATAVRTAHPDQPAQLAMLAKLEPKAPPAPLAQPARTAKQAARANLDPLAHPAQPDPRATTAPLAHSRRMDSKDAPDPPAQPERWAQPDRTETPDPLVPMDHPARMPPIALAPDVPTRRRLKCIQTRRITDHLCNVKAKIASFVSSRLAVESITTAATSASVIFACSMQIVSIQRSLL